MQKKGGGNPLILLLKHNANIELMNVQNHTFLDVLGRLLAFNVEGCVDFLEILQEVKNPFAIMRFAESKFAREQLPGDLMSCIWGRKSKIGWTIRDQEGNTYLHYLVMHRSGEEIQGFFDHRPFIYQKHMNTKNKEGLTPYELAKKLNKLSQETFEPISKKSVAENARREEWDRVFRKPGRAISSMLSSFASRVRKTYAFVIQLFKVVRKFFSKLAWSYQ
jgi:hypothetical protein